MDFSELIYPSCPLCRTLRISMCIGLLVVIVTYMAQLVKMQREG